MKSKGAVKLFAIALTLVCIFQLSFTWVTNKVETEAKEFANGDPIKEREYLDSIARLPVYNLGITEFTYLQCKERELNLGLDLQGGMNVTMEVSIGDLIRSLSNNSADPTFNKAIDVTNEKIKKSRKDYVTLFGESMTELDPNVKLAAIFANASNKDKIKISSSNDEVISYIKGEAELAVDRSFQILRSRIDKFGVTQPNIQKLEGSGRILIELPGVDNPTRVRKLLQGTAKLEFWETFDNPEAFKYLSSANEMLKKVLANEKNGVTTTDSTAVVGDTATATSALAGLGSKAVEEVKSDSAKKDTAQKSVEEFTKENPLFILLRPYADEQNMLIAKGSMCGTALVKDTAKINSYLNRPEVKAVLPGNVRFLWAYKGFGTNGEGVILHALKTSKEGKASMEGDKIVDARRDISQNGQTEVSMTMNAEGGRAWAKLTKENVGHSIAIVLDDVVYSAPNVQNEIPNGRSSISGGFTSEEAGDLANILKAGKLPAPARITSESVVGPTLGQEAINAGLLSMVIAILTVFLFMALYYNRSGLVADVVLFINVFFVMGVLTSIGAVLTLPGIAGIVLTIGLAVDANILIFERVREELAQGKSISQAISEGFKHAMPSIIDSNVTLLLLGTILYVFGTGPIQGFATTLIIGILSSLFAAVLISRVIFEWMLSTKKEITFDTKFTRNAFKNLHFDFVGRRKIYYMISTAVIIIGTIFYFKNGGFNLGVDFKGGRTYIVRFENTMNTEDVKISLEKVFNNSQTVVQTLGNANQLKITTSYHIENTDENADREVETTLAKGLESVGSKYEIVQQQKVGPTVATDIVYGAYGAILFSCLLMFVYIIVRFKKWQYGMGAVVALFHDVLIVLSFYTIFDNILPFSLEIGQDFIAAILTVMGYTMTETVIVFDRIRERLGERGQVDTPGEERNKLINFALNSTLSRTILTSLSVFFVLVVIFIFGGESIRGFIFALLVGRVIGTYSSLCISTPIVVDFDKKAPAEKAIA
ncbi:MAG: protein translocase subunit SecDF [Bacteroidota bacterium]